VTPIRNPIPKAFGTAIRNPKSEIPNPQSEIRNPMSRHFIHHKPFGYLCQFVCELPRKKLVGSLWDFPEGTMSIGRLDEHSEGLLLLTTDGMVSELIRGRKVEKEYYAQVDGIITDEALQQLETGVEIGIRDVKYNTLPCRVKRVEGDPGFAPRTKKIRDERHGPTSWISLTITEGKYRQVRKMTAAAGFPTLRLIRVRIGNILLGDLLPGEVREVGFFDIPGLEPDSEPSPGEKL
jgi:23S rRNA pseudouridine2457 synthase